MKFALITSLLLAGAGLANAQLAVEEPTRNELTHLRFGHAVVNKPDVELPTEGHIRVIVTSIARPAHANHDNKSKTGCGGSKMRSKAIQVANALRKAFGLAPIKTHHHHHHQPPPATEVTGMHPNHKDGAHIMGHHDENMVHHHGHKFHHKSFNARLQRALMSLGPWEGGAVAFVLGCGIGVLLRMFFVLLIVAVRGIRASRSENEYIQIDAEEIIVAPPQYTDEKVEAV